MGKYVTLNDLNGIIGRGSSHKQVYNLRGEPKYCFVVIPKSKEQQLDMEIKNYAILSRYGVRIPDLGLKQDITIDDNAMVGIIMEKLEGVEYKQTLSWAFVKKQIDKWEHNKKAKLLKLSETIDCLLNSCVMITDLQAFILDSTGEMVVFDPSTASYVGPNKKPNYSEIEHIKVKVSELIRVL